MLHPHKQGQIQDFLREGTSQPEMTDVSGHNWLTDCFNRIFDCSNRVFRFLQSRWQGTAGIW